MFAGAYGLRLTVGTLHRDRPAATVAWNRLPHLIEAYETNNPPPLSMPRWRAIAPLAVALTLYHVGIAGYSENPVLMVGDRMGWSPSGSGCWRITTLEITATDILKAPCLAAVLPVERSRARGGHSGLPSVS